MTTGRLARVALCVSALLLCVSALLMLSACGDEPILDAALPPPPTATLAHAPARHAKALLIGVDGVHYDALQQAMRAHYMPTLQGLGTVLPAYTGGIKGHSTQQQASDGPAWATLLTGAWADRHEIRSNYEGQGFKTDTIFKLLKQSHATARTAVFASWSGLPQLLRADQAAGYLDLAQDCKGNDSCVSAAAAAAIEHADYALIVADYQGPAQVADVTGYGIDYQRALAQVDAQIATLQAALAQRRATRPHEDWLVIVATTHGLGATGVADGIPVPSNLATVIALDKPATLMAAAPASLPMTIEPWYAYAAATDIAPTLLTHLGARPVANQYAIAGSPLIGATGVRQLSAATNQQSNGIQLTWALPSPSTAITVLRDGATIATLAANAAAFEDTTMAPAASGVFAYDYTVVADQVPVSLRATLNYVQPLPPAVLLPSLTAGLTHLFPLNNTLADRIDGTQAFTPWVSGATAVYVAAGDGPFGGTSTALQSTNYAGPTVCLACDGGYRMATTKITSTATSFSFGFWFRSDATRSGVPIVSNKNWGSGNNAGLAIGQYGNALRFNIGSGSKRLGDKNLNFSANTWVYVAMTVDVPGLKATFYVFDPSTGLHSAAAPTALHQDFVAALNGLNQSLTLNEDGDGSYGPNYRNGPGAKTLGGRCDFGEFSSWERVLTPAEVESIGRSGTSLTTLLP